jgi:hypothetical protein
MITSEVLSLTEADDDDGRPFGQGSASPGGVFCQR